MKKKIDHTLDEEEKKFLDAFERGEFKRVDDFEKELTTAQQAASNFFKKNARINIRLSNTDLIRLKRIAAHEGLPYQTLISSVLHKYPSTHLS